MQTSMLYTMGMALDRAADSGTEVSLLVESSWIVGRVAALDGQGVVLESNDGFHSVVRIEKVSAVTVHSEAPFRAPRTPIEEMPARPMAGPRVA